MATHKSALKRARQNVTRRARNVSLRSAMRTELRKAIEALTKATNRVEALKALSDGGKAMQKAASKGLVPKARASRTISRIAKRVNDKFTATAAR